MVVSERRLAFNRAALRAIARGQQVAVRHWLFVLNLTAGFYLGLAFLAPALSAAGWTEAGSLLFQAYHLACHQLPGRSFFVFGEQVAFCQRDVAIFGAILLAGLVYAAGRGRLQAPNWRVYGLLVLPMAIDGTTQLLGWRESTWELRVATGVLFGVATVWFLYPYIERTMVDLWSESLDLLARAGDGGRSRQGG
jgi:uncharacterized membrane protein